MRQFRDQRDWRQFHDPKNLAEAVSIEAGEILECFLWHSTDECKRPTDLTKSQLSGEVADTFIFLFYLSDALDLDLIEITREKLQANRKRYPVKEARGSRAKYTEMCNETVRRKH